MPSIVAGREKKGYRDHGYCEGRFCNFGYFNSLLGLSKTKEDNNMDMQEVISRAERNIRQALRDYGAHTSQTDVLEDVTNEFIYRLAADSSYAKQGLRKLFSKSPVWNEELDALVINGTRTHDPDYDRIHRLAMQILEKPFKSLDYDYNDILKAVCFFSNPDASERDRESYIEAIRKLAPKAYTPTKKPSRVFKSLCVTLGVADETAGSEFQRLYAQFADELSAKQIGFKLFVNINPAHFITMSNPKRDSRGATLTSCHSFNSTEYDYNNGCTGYARDETSFIVFTVADPTDPETLNNRKTTRQVFAYRPGSGLLLQSRMYNTAGGVYGAAADSKLYRDLVQREISALEDVPNLWKTYSSIGDKADLVVAGDGFGGYQDWTYENFDGHISIRADCDEETVDPLDVGTYGLCIVCGEETSAGVYCEDCGEGNECDECGGHYRELYDVRNSRGEWIQVCERCRDEYYTYCDECEEYWPNDCTTEVDGRYYCDDCLDECCERCDECDEWHRSDSMYDAYREGREVRVCSDCRDEHYYGCDCCGDLHHYDDMHRVYRANGYEDFVCNDCADNYDCCPHCDELIEIKDDGTCPSCGAVIEEQEDEAV